MLRKTDKTSHEAMDESVAGAESAVSATMAVTTVATGATAPAETPPRTNDN